ncbi:hypothetical protein RchiOBHm_Chr3g0480481 [Rosa chinensis]|uniref:Uncharacterized protein n=1 Tax=Rosa chinensis TaxID=74649 RepID=A0A2P6RDM5_ROSCH|nr:hypothetical protein RchiOBHm_Chr3g0480481 [Rosa chinensis]
MNHQKPYTQNHLSTPFLSPYQDSFSSSPRSTPPHQDPFSSLRFIFLLTKIHHHLNKIHLTKIPSNPHQFVKGFQEASRFEIGYSGKPSIKACYNCSIAICDLFLLLLTLLHLYLFN